MAIYEIENFGGGISDFDDRGIRGSFKMGKNLDIRKNTDSISSGQALTDEGLHSSASPSSSTSPSASVSRSISPSPSPSPSPTTGISASPSTTPSVSVSLSPSATPSRSISPSPSPSGGAGVTTIFVDLILFFVKCTDGFTYGFGNTGCVYRRDGGSGWLRGYKTAVADGASKGASEWYTGASQTYLYFATDTKLFKKPIPGLSNWNDVETVGTNLTSSEWHTMRECGGSLIIANNKYLALVGYDGSYTNEALDLIPGNIAKTIVERNGRTIVGTSRQSDPSKSINASIDTEVPLSQVGEDGQIYFANMTDSIPVKRFPGGGKCNPGGVCNSFEQINFFEWEQNALSWIDKQAVGNLAMFGVYSADEGYGGVYSYGRTDKNKPFTLNLDYSLDVDEIGALVNVDGTLLISYRDGATYGVKAVDSTTKAVGTYDGLEFKAPTKIPISITHWKEAELFMKPLPSGASVEYYYRMNKISDFVRARTASGETSFAVAGGKKAVFSISAEGEIFEHRIVLNPTFNVSPEIYRERIMFS